MDTYYIDETGFTGEDLLAPDQPIFVEATNNFTAEEAQAIIDDTFGGVKAKELKHGRLARNANHRDRIVELVRIIANENERAGIWFAHKEFALVTFIVEWWMEPLAHRQGLNLYKDGANLAMANMLFMTLQGFWSSAFRRRLLLRFQRMFRARTQERFSECEAFVARELARADGDRTEILHYFWPSFSLLGLDHVKGLPKRVLDLALPGLVLIGHKWRERDEGPWNLVHDQSSNMASQKWLWDSLTSPDLPVAQFDHPAGTTTFPMNVSTTVFDDSAAVKQLQICDLLAGATAAFLQFSSAEGVGEKYHDQLAKAGIEKLVLGNIWPSTEVTPEGLGMKGWDGNVAIDWISDQVEAARNKQK